MLSKQLVDFVARDMLYLLGPIPIVVVDLISHLARINPCPPDEGAESNMALHLLLPRGSDHLYLRKKLHPECRSTSQPPTQSTTPSPSPSTPSSPASAELSSTFQSITSIKCSKWTSLIRSTPKSPPYPSPSSPLKMSGQCQSSNVTTLYCSTTSISQTKEVYTTPSWVP